jgi:hypothetical protein
MQGGYGALGCKDKDFSAYYQTPCMVKVLFQTLESDMKQLGIDLKIKHELRYTDFNGYDVACVSPRCVAEVARVWKDKNNSPGIDVLLLPKSDSVQGHTRAVADINKGKTVTALRVGKAQSFANVHLFRHELSHVMGFDMHLYDNQSWTFRSPVCADKLVVPYEQSGLKRGCENMTPLGSYIVPGQVCTRLTATDPSLNTTRFNVPKYEHDFRYVFSCWLEANTNKKELPPPGVCDDLKKQLQLNKCTL